VGDDPLGDLLPLLPDSWAVRAAGVTIGGCSLEDLAREYGTPLYIYDEATIRGAARDICRTLAPLDTAVSFAAKACSTPAVLQILAGEVLGLDAVSLGEMELGLHAGFEPGRIVLHGNCKTDEELETAVRLSIRAVVLDGLEEIERLERICSALGKPVSVMLRLTLPFEAHTHPAVQTAGPASKFGFLHGSEDEAEALRRLTGSRQLRLVGLHTHMGSQIADPAIYTRALTVLAQLADSPALRGIGIGEINVGGGWAVPYVPGAPRLSSQQVADALTPALPTRRTWNLAVELGRALMARAGVAVYRIGAIKRRGGTRLIAVDGGMGDNPRPALYGARYSAISVEHPCSPAGEPADVVGRYCESGDILAREVPLPDVVSGEHLLVPVSGAYQLSMASSYNGVPPPAVVLVHQGQHRLVTRRGSIGDLLSREMAADRERAATDGHSSSR
jgi:diaminopimelate decarboxylase